MKPLVLYHAGCWDGFCAAWVARKRMGDIEAVPVQYGTEPPTELHRDVYVLDFSYPRETLLRMAKEALLLLVLDHHATAKQALDGLRFCRFADDKSGGRMTWEHFFGPDNAPWLVDYTEDRDLWRHRLPDSQAVNAALRSYPLDFELWDGFANQHPVDFVREGEAIRRRELQIINDHVRYGRDLVLDGHEGRMVNATVLFSEIAGELAKDHAFGACYFDRQDGKRVWSLRSSANGIDVSVIAKAHGGGGHVHAAGFEEEVKGRSAAAPGIRRTPED